MIPWNTTSSTNSKTDATNLIYMNEIAQLQVRRQASLRTTESASNRSIFTQVSWIPSSKTANTIQKDNVVSAPMHHAIWRRDTLT